MFRTWVVISAFIFVAMSLVSCSSGEPIDLLIRGGTVLTMDGEGRVIENGAVAIQGDHIVAVGLASDLEARFRYARTVQAEGGLILPGLINTHTHAAMTLYRGAADDKSLQDWLENYIFPLEAKLTKPEMVYWGTKLAAQEMIQGGITTFVDMYYFEDQVAEASAEVGIRVVAGETILDFPSPDFKTPQETLQWTEKFIERWKNHPLVIPAAAPHSAYLLAPEYLQASAELAERTGTPLLIHLAETQKEIGESLDKHEKTPVAYLADMGFFRTKVLGAHCVWVDENDRAILAENHVGCSHNPSSNTKLASGIAPVTELRAAGVPVGLGTDGPSGSNNDLNLFEEMDLAAKLQKVTQFDPTVLPAHTVVEMATIEGARALGLENMIGSLEAGKRADVIVVSRDGFHALPYYDDEYSQLVYALKAGDVTHSVINGRVVMENRRVLTIDEQELRERVERFAAKVREVLKKK